MLTPNEPLSPRSQNYWLVWTVGKEPIKLHEAFTQLHINNNSDRSTGFMLGRRTEQAHLLKQFTECPTVVSIPACSSIISGCNVTMVKPLGQNFYIICVFCISQRRASVMTRSRNIKRWTQMNPSRKKAQLRVPIDCAYILLRVEAFIPLQTGLLTKMQLSPTSISHSDALSHFACASLDNEFEH